MTTQEAKICPTCQFIETGDQDDHSCLDHLQKVNKELIKERAQLYDVLGRLKSVADEALQFYVNAERADSEAHPRLYTRGISPWK